MGDLSEILPICQVRNSQRIDEYIMGIMDGVKTWYIHRPAMFDAPLSLNRVVKSDYNRRGFTCLSPLLRLSITLKNGLGGPWILAGMKGIDVDRANDHVVWVMTISSLMVTLCAVSASFFYMFD